ncbi:MAG: hypothetical protein JJ979_17305 [Roseibium sp.]|nr:hypothetical protein [Roseibium sp.]
MPDINIEMLYPRFVFHKQYADADLSPNFNERLKKVAIEDAVANRVPAGGHERAIGTKATHLAHLRHNFLMDATDPVVGEFAQMVDTSIREYLSAVYHYDHEGDIEMMSDTFWQSRERGENVGINCHTHFRADLVVTYYVENGLDPQEDNPLRKGAVRFYDPQNLGVRTWPNNNPGVFTNGWFHLVPKVGSLVIFEGHMPHDSTYFGGAERLCIPVMCDVKTGRSHDKSTLAQILQNKGGSNDD